MAKKLKVTLEPSIIQLWAEERNALPAAVKVSSENSVPGTLRFIFEDKNKNKDLKVLSWDSFFKTFDKSGLCFVYKEKGKKGKLSHFGKFIEWTDAQDKHIGAEESKSWIISSAVVVGIIISAAAIFLKSDKKQ